jgi:hypothetical protein
LIAVFRGVADLTRATGCGKEEIEGGKEGKEKEAQD